MSLQASEKVQKLQTALHAKAKEEPSFRFYVLYDKVYRDDVVAEAWRLTKAKGGGAGVDGQTFRDIAAYGVERWLSELAEDLRTKTYRPQPVRRVHIPKPDGRQRPLGIPAIRDRVAQTAAVLVLAPIFEADLQPEQYAYRPGRSAHDAVRRVHSLLNTGHRDVVDADLSGYFDSIPHAELMKSVSRRVSDRHMLALIKLWLVMPVVEEDGRGGRRRTNPAKRSKRGIPQGAPISPLLSNLYMRRFVLGWKVLGHAGRLDAHIVNYADDLTILCRGTADQAMAAMRAMMTRLKLTVNEDKTHLCRAPDTPFDFLGYTFGWCYSAKTGRAYIGTRPSKKSIAKVCRTISDATSRRWLLKDTSDRVDRLNQVMTGWSNYFCLGPVSKAYRAVDAHARTRLRWWLCAKHGQSGRGLKRFSDEHLYMTIGLNRLSKRTRDLPWAKA
jgi:group II intron reverse transcriptase/maturase